METHRVQMFCQFENQIVNEKLKLQTKSSKKKRIQFFKMSKVFRVSFKPPDQRPSVHADYVEKLTCAMASLDLHTVQCYLPTKQPSPRI